MAKFKDPQTLEIIDVLTVRTSFINGEQIFKDKNGKQLVNINGIALIEVPREEWDENYEVTDVPSLMNFSMSSKADKQRILKKRSHEHFKREIKERQINENGGTGRQF